MWIIELNRGEYYQQRGGYDWGRCDPYDATTFGRRADAEREIEQRGLASFGGRVVEAR